MSNRIVLVSDDADFFDFIRTKLELRKSDELFLFSFDKAFENLHYFPTALFIINSDEAEAKTLEFLKILNGLPAIVIAYNDNDVFRRKCYRVGMFDFMSLLTTDAEFRARIIPALAVTSLLEKNKQYREILADNNIIAPNNDVFVDYEKILDKELTKIKSDSKKAVFMAISPNEQVKFLMQANLIETIILGNIRKNDVLMNFAANKYFLLLYNMDLKSAESLWGKVASQFQEKIYAGIVTITNQSRQQLINDALNKLHQTINNDRYNIENVVDNTLKTVSTTTVQSLNFKQFRQDFIRKIEQVLTPVFYQMQQKYTDKLSGVNIEQIVGATFGRFTINSKHSSAIFNVSAPGFSKINIDVTLQKEGENTESKRITIEPDELEQGLLSDLLEQFITEYKKEWQDE